MSGLDESGIILSAMLEAEIEAADPEVALLVAEAKSEELREIEKENNEIWKEKIAARKARVSKRKFRRNRVASYKQYDWHWASNGTACASHYYRYDTGTGGWSR